VRADLAPYFRGMTDGRVTRSGKIGTLGLVASPGGGLTLKANYGRHYRIPSLMEVFGYRGMTIPNPSLEPEVGLNRDVGVAWGKNLRAGTLLSAEYVYFWSDVERLIMFVYVPYAQASQAINIDSARIKGCEISLSFGTWHGVTLSGNLTHLDAINTGKISYQKGKHLPQRPETEAFAGLRWRHRGLAIFYEFDYVSGNYWNAANGKAPNNKGPLFPIRRLQSAGITVPAGVPNSSFTLEVRNLQDQRYEDVMGYPLPGRSVHGTLMLSL
jgi:outer membrane receptor protein involved in Fe transport